MNEFRKALNLSHREFCKKLNVSSAYLCSAKCVTPRILLNLAKMLHVDEYSIRNIESKIKNKMSKVIGGNRK